MQNSIFYDDKINWPSCLRDDHFGAEMVELVPQILHLQVNWHVHQLVVQRLHLLLFSGRILTVPRGAWSSLARRWLFSSRPPGRSCVRAPAGVGRVSRVVAASSGDAARRSRRGEARGWVAGRGSRQAQRIVTAIVVSRTGGHGRRVQYTRWNIAKHCYFYDKIQWSFLSDKFTFLIQSSDNIHTCICKK